MTAAPDTTLAITRQVQAEALSVRREPAPMTMGEMTAAADAMFASGLFADVKSKAQALVKVMAGREIGIEPFAAMTGIEITQGKTCIKPVLMAAKVKASGKYDYRVIEANEKRCEIQMYQQGVPIGPPVVFTAQDSIAAGLAGNANYKKYPADMLFARAMSRAVRRNCPDVFMMPVYVEGEIDNPIPAQPRRVENAAAGELPTRRRSLAEELDSVDEPATAGPAVEATQAAPEAAPVAPKIGAGKAAFIKAVQDWSGVSRDDIRSACASVARKLGYEQLEGISDLGFSGLANEVNSASKGGAVFAEWLASK